MELCNILFLLGVASTFHLTTAGPVRQSDAFEGPFVAKQDTEFQLKSKNVDMVAATALIRSVIKESNILLNPCHLFEAVQEDVRKAPQKSKVKPADSAPPAVGLTRSAVFNMALPAIRDGISLYRTTFVLQNTANLTVFLDQNRDDVYANTSLRSYSHYYVRAANEEITQILFIGLIKNDDLQRMGSEAPAMEFLAANGLIRHPRQYVDFATIPRQEAKLVLATRQQMADLLRSQGTYWENDADYLTNVLTIAFNGPEQETEMSEVLPKILKNYVHKVQEQQQVPKPVGEDLYEAVCQQQKASDDAALEAVALFAL